MALDLVRDSKIAYKQLFSNTDFFIINFILIFVNHFLFGYYLLLFKTDIIVSRSSLHSVIMGKILAKPHVALFDTEHSKIYANIWPTDASLVPNSFKGEINDNTVVFEGNMELLFAP